MNQKSEMTLPYVKVGDYYYPNFAVPPPVGDIGYYGRLRRKCLIEHHPVLLNQLVLSGKLFEHLADINRQATERRDVLMQQMNNIRACVDEIILEEIVFA